MTNRERQAKWRAAHPEKARAATSRYRRKYYEGHKEQEKAYNKEYRAAHPEKVEEWRTNAARRLILKQTMESKEYTDLIAQIEAEGTEEQRQLIRKRKVRELIASIMYHNGSDRIAALKMLHDMAADAESNTTA